MKMLKIISLILVSLFLLVACSTELTNPIEPTNENTFSPPSWIIGNWRGTVVSTTLTYSFLSNDVYLSVDNQGGSLKDATNVATITEDVKSATEYRFTLLIEDASWSHRFVKITDTTLDYSIPASPINTFRFTKY